MSERSLRGYLLLPRPGDLVKAWIFPAAFAFGVVAAGGAGGRELLRAAVIWAALELLIYQARYQWNDIRGFEADQRHPDRVARGRLPGPVSRGRKHIRASALVAAARLTAAAILAVALPSLDLAAPLLVLAFAVFAVAALYEALRARATGHSDRVPPPVSGGILAIWAVIGGGYAIRALAGLAAAVSLFDPSGLLVAASIASWAFGIAFVTGRWALEALAFGRPAEGGGISWQVSAAQAREHLLALTRWLPAAGPGGAAPAVTRLEDWRALRGTSLRAPWNLAAIVAAAAAAAAGRLLAGPADLAEVLFALAIGALAAALAFAPRSRRWPVMLSSAIAFALLLGVTGSPRPGLVVLPWAAVLGAHLFFTAQSPRTLVHPLRFALAAAWAAVAPEPRRRPVVSPLPRR